MFYSKEKHFVKSISAFINYFVNKYFIVFLRIL